LYDGKDLMLRPGKVTTLRGELKLKPSLDVRVNVDSEAPREMFIHVGRERVPVKNHEMKRIEALDAAPLRVFLEIPPWKLVQDADLSDGRDATIAYDLSPIKVSGVVRYGRDRAKAKI